MNPGELVVLVQVLLSPNERLLFSQDAEKRTPLHAAAFLGDAEITELLILSGNTQLSSTRLSFYISWWFFFNLKANGNFLNGVLKLKVCYASCVMMLLRKAFPWLRTGVTCGNNL